MISRLPDLTRWLAAGVPLTLLVDLLDENGPNSQRIYAEEPSDLDWVPTRSVA